MFTPKLTKAELRAQLEAALAKYNDPVTREQRKFDHALRQIARLKAEPAARSDNLKS